MRCPRAAIRSPNVVAGIGMSQFEILRRSRRRKNMAAIGAGIDAQFAAYTMSPTLDGRNGPKSRPKPQVMASAPARSAMPAPSIS
jgi:hypothetical protein